MARKNEKANTHIHGNVSADKATLLQMLGNMQDTMTSGFERVEKDNKDRFDQLHQGQKALYEMFQKHTETFQEHVTQDQKDFENIRTNIATAKVEKQVEDKDSDKKLVSKQFRQTLWAGIIGAGGSGGLITLIQHFWH